jgi:hypothetical protein
MQNGALSRHATLYAIVVLGIGLVATTLVLFALLQNVRGERADAVLVRGAKEIGKTSLLFGTGHKCPATGTGGVPVQGTHVELVSRRYCRSPNLAT